VIIRGKVIFKQYLFKKRETLFKTLKTDYSIYRCRHHCAKVRCQEGNSPDRKLRCLIVIKSKEEVLKN